MSKSLNLVFVSLGITLASIVLLPNLAFARHHGPGGTYKRSCTNIYTDGNGSLQAMCKNSHGNWQPASLENASSCASAENIDGHLQCRRHRDIPVGSYLQSCTNRRVDGDTLYATCKDQNRHWQTTSLNNFRQCPQGSISNLNGHLTCPF